MELMESISNSSQSTRFLLSRKYISEKPITTFSLIINSQRNGGIGIGNIIPWHSVSIQNQIDTLLKDSRGKSNAVLMGLKTYMKFYKDKTLKDVKIIVLSKNIEKRSIEISDEEKSKMELRSDFLKTLEEFSKEPKKYCTIFVIGGTSIFKQAFENIDIFSEVYQITMNHEEKNFECDQFLEFPSSFIPDEKTKSTNLDQYIEKNKFKYICGTNGTTIEEKQFGIEYDIFSSGKTRKLFRNPFKNIQIQIIDETFEELTKKDKIKNN